MATKYSLYGEVVQPFQLKNVTGDRAIYYLVQHAAKSLDE